MGDSPDRSPPSDLEAEMSLLGSILVADSKRVDVLAEVLQIIPKDKTDRFFDADHRELYPVLIDMRERRIPIDLTTVRDALRRREMLKTSIGKDWVAYLMDLVESVPDCRNATHYARIVADLARLRDVIAVCHDASRMAYAGKIDAAEVLDTIDRNMQALTDRRIVTAAPVVGQVLIEEFKKLDDGAEGIPTGFRALDETLVGLHRGELTIVAARPSMGKTAFGLDLARKIAQGFHNPDGAQPVAFFSMEMGKSQIAHRIMSAEARISAQRLRQRSLLNDAEAESVREVMDRLARTPLHIDNSANLSLLDLRARARQQRRKNGVQVIIVDYLQLMHMGGRVESRQVEVSAISRGLKGIARELDIPVVVLSQLNRNSEGRADNRPRMSDLRESGATEQDADVILLLHREEYYSQSNCPPDRRGVAEVIVAKQRNGPTGIVNLFWNNISVHFCECRELSPEEEQAMVTASAPTTSGLYDAAPANEQSEIPF